MRFATKVFLAIFLPALGLTVALSAGLYAFLATSTRAQYVGHYQSVARQVAQTLAQLESTTDVLMAAAVRVLAERVRHEGVLSSERLLQLRDELGVTHLYILNDEGVFQRATSEDPAKLPNAYSFCPRYRQMFQEGQPFEPTGIMPGIPNLIPHKFLFLSSADRKHLLEVGVRVDFIGQTLRQTLSADAAILSLALYAPNGASLGEFTAEGTWSHERSLEPSRTFTTGTVLQSGRLQITERVAASRKECCSCRTRGLIGEGDYHYYLRTQVSTRSLDSALRRLTWMTGGLACLGLALSLLLSRWLSRRLVARIDHINEQAHAIMETGDLGQRINLSGTDEVGRLSAQIDGMLAALQVKQEELLRFEKSRAVIETTEQVVHDIRSPLAALDTLLKLSTAVPESQRVLLRTAVQRIRDISSSLLEQTRRLRSEGNSNPRISMPAAAAVPESLWLMLNAVVAEKRHQYHARTELRIEVQQLERIYPLFVSVHAPLFHRVLSNLIDNAAEAVDAAGSVQLSAEERGDRIRLRIQDSGRGIPADVLPTLAEKRRTFGKPHGSGLGLYAAKNALADWGGALHIESREGEGTAVTVTLPKAQPPSWFVPAVVIPAGATVVVVDDDESIHAIWRSRLAVHVESSVIHLTHFASLSEFRASCARLRSAEAPLLILMDYEFQDTSSSGLECLGCLGLAHCSILVTSRSQDPEIRAQCESAGMGLLPKMAASFVAIRVTSEQPTRAASRLEPLIDG